MRTTPMLPFPQLANIHAVPIPMPGFPDLGTANVYVLGARSLTLIDAGPKYPGSLDFLQGRLQDVGRDLTDVERIIITHGHVDHFGLAAAIRGETGRPVECFVHPEDAWRLSTANLEEDVLSGEALDYMAMVGLPADEVHRIRRRYALIREFCDPLEDFELMEDGDEFMGEGYHLRVIHTPGHSPGNCCLYEGTQQILFSGDHLLKHTTPNPLMEIRRERLRDPDYQSLRVYLDSLEKLTDLEVQYVFPGHGEYFEDLPGIIAAYSAHHAERMERVWQALKRQSRPIYALIGEVFPHVPEDDTLLAISEIMVHLELLVNAERARLVDPGPPALYQAL